VLLRRLLNALPEARTAGPVDIDIRSIAHDSRAVDAGTLFVAMPPVGGPRNQGIQDHVSDAIHRGASAIVTGIPVETGGVTTVSVSDPRAALADLAAQFYGHPSRKLHLYAVTGTDGKTTTSFLLEQILAAAGHVTGLLGTVETKIGEQRERNLDRMTTPEALEVQRLLRQMVDAGVTHAVMEASSHALALDRLRACTFAACALTNITADHVEFHGSWEAYFAAKAKLFSELAPQSPAILNHDDAHIERWLTVPSGPIVTYGLGEPSDIRAVEIDAMPAATAFTIETSGQRVRTRIALPGIFNVSNALAATGLALAAGITLPAIASGLEAASAPPGRMERVDLGQNFAVIVDYAHTEHAFRSVLSTLRERDPGGRLIAVFGATGNRDRGKRPNLGRIARDYTDYFIITNEDPYGEQPDAIITEVASGLPREEEGTRYVREADRGDAIRQAVEAAGPGDTVIILGKGHEQSIVVEGRKVPWSDVAAVRQAIGAGI
jgi:UDP-N-acetylmuramoyl-L-alanyl-D-glutamate--2,6-diaminopimelate ligase